MQPKLLEKLYSAMQAEEYFAYAVLRAKGPVQAEGRASLVDDLRAYPALLLRQAEFRLRINEASGLPQADELQADLLEWTKDNAHTLARAEGALRIHARAQRFGLAAEALSVGEQAARWRDSWREIVRVDERIGNMSDPEIQRIFKGNQVDIQVATEEMLAAIRTDVISAHHAFLAERDPANGDMHLEAGRQRSNDVVLDLQGKQAGLRSAAALAGATLQRELAEAALTVPPQVRDHKRGTEARRSARHFASRIYERLRRREGASRAKFYFHRDLETAETKERVKELVRSRTHFVGLSESLSVRAGERKNVAVADTLRDQVAAIDAYVGDWIVEAVAPWALHRAYDLIVDKAPQLARDDVFQLIRGVSEAAAALEYPAPVEQGRGETRIPQGLGLDRHVAKIRSGYGKSTVSAKDVAPVLTKLEQLREKQAIVWVLDAAAGLGLSDVFAVERPEPVDLTEIRGAMAEAVRPRRAEFDRSTEKGVAAAALKDGARSRRAAPGRTSASAKGRRPTTENLPESPAPLRERACKIF